jgi:hypothetical protein
MDYPNSSDGGGGGSQAFTGPPPSYSAPVGAAAAAARARGRSKHRAKAASRAARAAANRAKKAAAKAAAQKAATFTTAAAAAAAGQAAAEKAAAQAAALAGLRLAGRLIPWLAIGLTLYDLWRLWDELNNAPMQEGGLQLEGWTHHMSCCGGGPEIYVQNWFSGDCSTISCAPWPGGVHTSGTAFQPHWNYAVTHDGRYGFKFWQWNGDPINVWKRDGATTPIDVSEITNAPGYISPVEVPPVPPELDPGVLLPGRVYPSPKKMPLPYRILPARVPNPHRSPTEQTERGNDLAYPPGHPLADPSPSTLADPYRPSPNDVASAIADDLAAPQAGTGIVPPVGTGNTTPTAHELYPRSRPRPGREHERRPPSGGEREGKYRAASSVSRLVNRALSQATEAADHLKCLYNSLPRDKKTAGPSNKAKAQDMAADVWDNWLDHGDVGKTLFCIITNELEDRIIGGFGKLIAGREARHGTNQVIGFVGRTRPARQAFDHFSGVTF